MKAYSVYNQFKTYLAFKKSIDWGIIMCICSASILQNIKKMRSKNKSVVDDKEIDLAN